MVVIVIISTGDPRADLLLSNENKFKKGEQIIQKVQYFLKLCNL